MGHRLRPGNQLQTEPARDRSRFPDAGCQRGGDQKRRDAARIYSGHERRDQSDNLRRHRERINIFDTSTNQFVYRYVDMGRDYSQLVIPGEVVDLQDHTAAQRLIRGSGPEQMFIRNNLLFVTMLHSDKVEVFKINPAPSDVSQVLSLRRDSTSPAGSRPKGSRFRPMVAPCMSQISKQKTSRSWASTPMAS